MILYSTRPTRLALQILIDVAAAAACVIAVVLGRAITGSIADLAGIGTRIHSEASSLQKSLGGAARGISQIPFGGRAASAPLRQAGDAAASLAAAGSSERATTLHLANLAGGSVIVILLLAVLILWLRYRGSYIRMATATHRIDRTAAGTELLALRALTTRAGAAKLGADVVDRWRRGDPATIAALADIERRSVGLRRGTARERLPAASRL